MVTQTMYKQFQRYGYKGFQENGIPEISLDEGKIRVQIISGNFNDTKGAFQTSDHSYL